eukprot:Phypoly_transcript_03450.p1 GENE.Phypoly_transcript_03450~~Phypoly_transcript_03450.p1  ORF type:complete len:749 (+),score=104.58 Phypoly_transcript_03450:69-2315(+)
MATEGTSGSQPPARIPPLIPPIVPDSNSGEITMKVVLLGAGGSNKSALSVQFAQGIFVEKYDPTIEDSYRAIREVDGRKINIEILDTAGTEQFTAMRDLYMKNGDGFILCFNPLVELTFNSITNLRETIVRVKDDDNVPIVVAGVMLTTAYEGKRDVSIEQGEQLAKKMDAVYIDVHCREKENVEEVFYTLIRKVLASRLGWTTPKKPTGLKKFFGSSKASPQAPVGPVHIRDKRLWQTKIHQAVIAKEANELAALLAADNSFVNAQDFYLRTALHYACNSPENDAIIKSLLAAGSSVTARDVYNNTPLHLFTAKSTDPHMWELLCLHVANSVPDFNFMFERNNRKQTPLDLAHQKGCVGDFIEVLLSKMCTIHNPMKLDLSTLTLETLPPNLFKVVALTALVLHHNSLSSLSPEIGSLVNLSHLDVSSNKMGDASIPLSLQNCTHMLEFFAQANGFTTIPHPITELLLLERLSMNKNKIESVPDSIAKLLKLKMLALESNNIKEITPQLSQMTSLEDINLAYNFLTSFPSTATLPTLARLNVSSNNLSTTPELSSSLVYLNLSSNSLQNIALPHGNTLEQLHLEHNNLTSLPEDFALASTRLCVLDLSNNQLQRIPHSISHLSVLRVLNLSNNNLTTLCDEVFSLPSVTELNISNNNVVDLPVANNMPNLTKLNLSNNPISILPAQLGQSTKLTNLDFTGTQVQKLPKSMAALKKQLRLLSLDPSILPLEIRSPAIDIQKAITYLTQ